MGRRSERIARIQAAGSGLNFMLGTTPEIGPYQTPLYNTDFMTHDVRGHGMSRGKARCCKPGTTGVAHAKSYSHKRPVVQARSGMGEDDEAASPRKYWLLSSNCRSCLKGVCGETQSRDPTAW